MKRLIWLFFITAFLSVSCDKPPVLVDYYAISYFVWINESDHVISLSGKNFDSEFDNKIIMHGQSLEKERQGMGAPPTPMYSYEEMVVVFDNGTKITYGRPYLPTEVQNPDVVYLDSFNPVWDDNYVREDLELGVRYTYTFTNADYEAAKKLSSQE